jgi:acyl-CoA thioesterase I
MAHPFKSADHCPAEPLHQRAAGSPVILVAVAGTSPEMPIRRQRLWSLKRRSPQRVGRALTAIACMVLVLPLYGSSAGGRIAPVLVIGDSVAAGVGASPGHGWADLLGQAIAVETHARSGATSGRFVALPPTIETEPIAIVVELGINDWIRGVEPATYAANVQAIVSRARMGGTAPAFVVNVYDMPRLNGSWGPYRAALLELNGISLIDTDRVDLTADGIHPSDSGHAAIAAAVLKELR